MDQQDSLNRVRHVLEELDRMPSVGAQLDFLRNKGPLVEGGKSWIETSIQEKLDQQEKEQAEFLRVQEALSTLRTLWDSSKVLPLETREVGTRLLVLLEQIQDQAKNEAKKKTWKSEIETLSELWPSDPDISGVFTKPPLKSSDAFKKEKLIVDQIPVQEVQAPLNQNSRQTPRLLLQEVRSADVDVRFNRAPCVTPRFIVGDMSEPKPH